MLFVRFLSVSPPAAALAIGYAVYMSRSAKTLSGAYGKADGIVQEVLHNLRTVVAFGGEEREVDRYVEQLHDARIQMWKSILKTFFDFISLQ